MVTIIAGTRTIRDFVVVRSAILKSGWWYDITEVVSGASYQDVLAFRDGKREPNVDILGAWWAIANELPVTYFPADWDNIAVPGAVIQYHRNGKPYNAAAGPMRNRPMAEYGEALILIWNGASKGSAGMKQLALDSGIAPERIFEERVKC